MRSLVLDFQEMDKSAWARWWKRAPFRELSKLREYEFPKDFA